MPTDASGWDVVVPEERAGALGLLVQPREAAQLMVKDVEGQPHYVNTLECLEPTSSTGDYVLTPSKVFGMEVALQLLAIRGAAAVQAETRLQECQMELTAVRQRMVFAEEEIETVKKHRDALLQHVQDLEGELSHQSRPFLATLKADLAFHLSRLVKRLERP